MTAPAETYPAGTAAAEGLATCHTCCKVAPESLHQCPLCGGSLHLRVPDSIQRTLALVVTASLLYIPANVLPITRTEALGKEQADTIMSGVLYFLKHGDWPLALVIFTASVAVPFSFAAATAAAMPRSKAGCAKPSLASTLTAAGFGRVTTGST